MANLRLFVAADLPAELLAAVGAVQAKLRPEYPALRWLDPKGMHLTLKFLGSIPEERVGDVTRITQEIATAAVPSTMATTALDAFPSWRSPRVVVLGCTVPEPLAALHAQLEPAYAGLGVPVEERAFRPHVTLARAKERRPTRMEPPAVTLPVHAIPVNEVVLYQSLPGPGGSRYLALGRFALGS